MTASGSNAGETFGLLGELAGRLGDNAADGSMRRLWRVAGAFFQGLATGDIAPDRESRLLLGQLGLALESAPAAERAGAEAREASADRLARQLQLRIARGSSRGAPPVSGTITGEGEYPGAEGPGLLRVIGDDLKRWRASGAGDPPLDSLQASFDALAEWAESQDREQVAGLARSVGRLISLNKGKKGAALDGMPDLLEEVRDGLQAELNDEPPARANLVESLNSLVSLLLPDFRQPDPRRQSLTVKDEAK
ncbi:MAG: hypothetical protein U9Q71_09010 [Pseudomonadota bacterium]|nr:hypothetical protein [Pseudomonadota bacterium]